MALGDIYYVASFINEDNNYANDDNAMCNGLQSDMYIHVYTYKHTCTCTYFGLNVCQLVLFLLQLSQHFIQFSLCTLQPVAPITARTYVYMFAHSLDVYTVYYVHVHVHHMSNTCNYTHSNKSEQGLGIYMYIRN